MNNRPEQLVPHFDRLPEPEQIVQMATWLAQAGLQSLELVNEAAGLRLRLCVGQADSGTAPAAPSGAVASSAAGAQAVTVTTAYFGRLCLAHPSRDVPLAPVGTKVAQGEVVALLALESLLLPVVAPVAGTVTEVIGQSGALVGYGAAVMRIRPD
ncbi:hypothetical protein CFR73_12175 [Novacetimonas maltaceti]|uniref:Lipoyl-binding domain-containing protein n=1 Tax=Novacetimonas maltaceti TaxID=1203393 RepID=A0A2S3W158_9PROT|nr:biotin/lipoyl-containing protein [Novacetimonas maltaceti]POF62615.1 hypothetical protein KMAL_17360 [Novacetimonas maltaceti]PYD59337.1 hypothetical protein CFR73_12175 [Novacetimonas maltaceti]